MRKTATAFIAFLFCAAAVLAGTPDAKIDTVMVEGTLLQGQVRGLSNSGITFSPIYGEGTIQIPYKKIEQLRTDHYYRIFYNGKASVGKIDSIHEHRWLVVVDGAQRELIDVDDIERFILSLRDDDSFVNRIHNYLPFWSGNFDVGVELEHGSVDKRKIDVGVRFEYNRLKQRVVLIGNREYDTRKTPDDINWSTSKDEYLFSIEDDHYLTRKQEEFLFLTSGFERDAVRQIQQRIYPAGGAGYKWSFDHYFWIVLQLGAGGVFDRYTTYGQENYFALYTGTEAWYRFRYGSVLRAKVLYMPSLFHERNAWLLRAMVSMEVPLTELFAMKLSVEDVDDNNPFPDIGNNMITTKFAFSFTF